MPEQWPVIVLSLLALQAYFVVRAVRRHRTRRPNSHAAAARGERPAPARGGPLTGVRR